MNFNQSFKRYLSIASDSYNINQIVEMHPNRANLIDHLKTHYELDKSFGTDDNEDSFFSVKSELRDKIACQIGINMLSKVPNSKSIDELVTFGKSLNEISIFIKAFKYIHKC